MGSISIREHIRWGSDAPSEPTSTVVLTSPGRRFVDIRVLKTAWNKTPMQPDEPPTKPLRLPRSSLDWAFGGTSSSSTVTRQDGSTASHAVFQHWVDSRTTAPEQTVDEGDMFPHPGGNKSLTLETGKMINPDTGVETAYEELWCDQEPQSGDDDDDGGGGGGGGGGGIVKSFVVQLHDDANGKRGLFVRLGKYAQGVLRVADDFTAERWEWDGYEKGQWKRLFRAGDENTESLERILENIDKIHHVGDVVDAAGGKWTVVEANGDQ